MKAISLNFCLSAYLLLNLIACGETSFYGKKNSAKESAGSASIVNVDADSAAQLRKMPIVDVIDTVLTIIPKNTSIVDGFYIGDSFEKIEVMRDSLLAFSDQYANMGEMLDALAPHQELHLTEAELKSLGETAVAKLGQINFEKSSSVVEEISYTPAFELQDWQPAEGNYCTVLKAIGSDRNRDQFNQWAMGTCATAFTSLAAMTEGKRKAASGQGEGDVENQIATDENGAKGTVVRVAGMALVASGVSCGVAVTGMIATGVSATYADANCEKREAAKRGTPK